MYERPYALTKGYLALPTAGLISADNFAYNGDFYTMRSKNFALYAWGVMGYNILVVLWGAFVRATGSGAGCGAHWPLCNGEIIPRAPRMETLIEFSHRLSSGVLGILMLVLLIGAFRLFSRGHAVRRAAAWSMFFVLTEAIIGAGLVKFEWVAHDDSVARIYTMAFHLVNTFFLLTALTLTAWFASGGKTLRLRHRGLISLTTGAALVGTLILGASGAITALGDTLYLQAGITPAESPVVAWLLNVRIFHPLLAVVVFGLVLWAARVVTAQSTSRLSSRFATWSVGLFVCQLALGTLNVILKAPVSIQLAHLLLSNLIWIMLVLMTATILADVVEPQVVERRLGLEERVAS